MSHLQRCKPFLAPMELSGGPAGGPLIGYSPDLADLRQCVCVCVQNDVNNALCVSCVRRSSGAVCHHVMEGSPEVSM